MFSPGTSNVMDMFMRGRLVQADRTMKQALERLSTGKRINRASDDPAQLMVADRLTVSKSKLEQSIEAAERQNHFLAAKDGAVSVVSDMVVELQGIVVQAGNRSVLGEGELKALQQQADSILNGIDYIAGSAKFNDELLLQGFDAKGLGLRKLVQDEATGDEDADSEQTAPRQFFDLFDGSLEEIQSAVDAAAKRLSTHRAAIGALMQQNESSIRQRMSELEATSQELSRIEDTDYAAEISKLVRGQMLKDVNIRGLLIHREQAASVLDLL